MNFYEAYSELKEGKKIRRKEWYPTLYLTVDDNQIIHSYIEEHVPFEFDMSIINSEDWFILNENEKSYSFMEILPFIEKGFKIRLKSWPEDYFITRGSLYKQDVYIRRIVKYDFVPSFICFTSNDWEVID